MSVKVMAHIWDLKIGDPTAKIVLLAYADHADHDGGNMYPAVATVAKKTEFSERTVQRATTKLEEMGLLLADGKSEYGTNRWRFNWEWQPLPEGVTECHPDTVSDGGDSVTGGGDRESEKQDRESPNPSSYPSSYPSESTPKARRATPAKPPAIETFQKATGRNPRKPLYEPIIAAVGEDEPDLKRWHDTCLAWVGCGWNPMNVKGMLECYQRGEIPGTAPPNRNGKERASMAIGLEEIAPGVY